MNARANACKSAEKLGKFVTGDGGPVDIDAKIAHRYEFLYRGRRHEVNLSHAESIWYVKVGSAVVATKAHNNSALKSFRTSIDFDIPDQEASLRGFVKDGAGSITARMTMEWVPRSMKWQYTLQVRDTVVPAFWSKVAGVAKEHA